MKIRFIKSVALLSIVHFVLTIALFFMKSILSPDIDSSVDFFEEESVQLKIVEMLVFILNEPALSAWRFFFKSSNNIVEWIFLAGNSILWGSGMTLITKVLWGNIKAGMRSQVNENK